MPTSASTYSFVSIRIGIRTSSISSQHLEELLVQVDDAELAAGAPRQPLDRTPALCRPCFLR